MPAAVSQTVRPTVEHDDLDDIFNYDAGIDATFNQAGRGSETHNNDTHHQADPDAQVNIDEEVKVTKKRKPVAKLDEDRLLSQQGIPKLRKIAKDRIRINGKGHEFTDMARLLNAYQLWLDDLFPKAKFMDGISMIEKLGHKKRIQMMRREWIEEGKPKAQHADDEDDFVIPNEDAAPENNSGRDIEDQPGNEGHPSGGQSGGTAEQSSHGNLEPDEDDLDALLAESESMPVTDDSKPNNAQSAPSHEPDDDELDALMTEDAQNNHVPKSLFGGPTPSKSSTAQPPPDDFDDDEEAMAGMDW